MNTMFSCVSWRFGGKHWSDIDKMDDIVVFSGFNGGLSTLLLSTLLFVYGNRVDITQPPVDMFCIVLSSLLNFKVLCDFPCVTINVNLQLVKYILK